MINIRHGVYTVKSIFAISANFFRLPGAVSPLMLDVRTARERRGLTQVELAERAAVRQATISAIENGQTSGVDFDVLERLANALGVEPGSLIVRIAPVARKR